MLNPYGVHAAREYLLEGNLITRLEAMVLFAVPDLTKIISDLRHEGTTRNVEQFFEQPATGARLQWPKVAEILQRERGPRRLRAAMETVLGTLSRAGGLCWLRRSLALEVSQKRPI